MSKDKTYLIQGKLFNQDNQPLAGHRIEAWDKDMLIDDFVAEDISDAEGDFTISFAQNRFRELFFDRKPDLYFKVFLKNNLVYSSENEALWNLETGDKTIKLIVGRNLQMPNIHGDNNDTYIVKGVVVSNYGVALSNYLVEAISVTLDKNILVGKTQTDVSGNYTIPFIHLPGTVAPDIQVKAYAKDHENAFSLSAIRYNAEKNEVLNVVVDEAKVIRPVEYDTILHEVESQLGKSKWSDLREDESVQHITYLSNKTGWDSRMVAMLVAARQFGEKFTIEPAHIYALFRFGVQGNANAIKTLPSIEVEKAIKIAVEKNIIAGSPNNQATLDAFDQLHAGYMLESKPFAAVSSMSDMLNLRLNKNQQAVFIKVAGQAGTNSAKLWEGLQQQGFSQEVINKLRLDGKLGFLTSYNVPLMKKVYAAFPMNSDTDLVSNGLYKASEWSKFIAAADVPAGITANDYAVYMANQVKRSYPTSIAGDRIRRNEINLGNNVPTKELSDFFTVSQQQNLLGTIPLKSWTGFANLSQPAKDAAQTYERLYQITPSDEAMTALADKAIYSAYQIAQFTKNEFLTLHSSSFTNLLQAEMTYNKASEVHSTALNIATAYITNRIMPNVYALTGINGTAPVGEFNNSSFDGVGGLIDTSKAQTSAYATLEVLFGNMDYCACQECKSVLSPAAYFVELLQFIDLKAGSFTKSNPYDILIGNDTTIQGRRPDLQHIQLTCENTNTALPYIDLVNEILEHYILNGNLTKLKDHNIPEDTNQSDLLAEPQFVEKAAYDLLIQGVFPYNLPFHQPLETLRRLFELWGTSLEKAFEIIGLPALSRQEALGLNEEEYKMLTSIIYQQLPGYFGHSGNLSIAQLNAAIASGKIFIRTVGISYEELVELLKTDFINPGYKLVPLLEKLHINLPDLHAFYSGKLSTITIPDGIKKSDYEGDVKEWLKKHQKSIMGLITLTLTGSEDAPCNLAQLELRYALPDKSANTLQAISYHKFHRFLRLRFKTGWSIQFLDSIINVLLPDKHSSAELTETNIDHAFKVLLNRLANFKKLAAYLSLSEDRFHELLQVLDKTKSEAARQMHCAALLQLSLLDLAALTSITGNDPLKDSLDDDEPPFLKLATATRQLKEQSLKIADLAYLLHHSDPTGKLAPTKDMLLASIRQLKAALVTVEKENSIAPDNADFEFAKSKMLLVYDAATTDQFFGLLLDTISFYVPTIIEESLPQKILAVNANLSFDPFKKQLVYKGVMSQMEKDALEKAAGTLQLVDMSTMNTKSALNAFITAFKNSVSLLFSNSNASLTNLSKDYPELKVVYDSVKAETDPARRAQKLVSQILPGLKTRQKTGALQSVLTSILKADPAIVSVLTSGKDIVAAAANKLQPVLFDFFQLEEELVFNQNKIYQFWIDVPVTDNYLFYVSAPEGTSILLGMEGQAKGQLLINGKTDINKKELSTTVALSLTAGMQLVEMSIINMPAGKQAYIWWRTKAMAKTVIPANAVYQSEKVDFTKKSLIRLLKAAQLQSLFSFTPAELMYLAAKNSETAGFINDLNIAVPTSQNPGNNPKALWEKIKHLIFFQSLKNDEPEENAWLQVLQNPLAVNENGTFVLDSFNGWKETDIKEILTWFAASREDLSKLSIVKKVKAAAELVGQIGYPAADVKEWITQNPSYNSVAGIKQSIKQNNTEAAWLEIIPAVSDQVRNLLRDALVSFILQYKKPSAEITNADKLYEYFLIDVEMDACMKTSRIRQAISTVQLFIQRCLLNLEPAVAPASIKSEQWAWMKRYRVWEANRKVFLYPENWLEPELRDNKSYLFKELEGELMQGEITDEAAELAFLNYLKKLDDIAKLEIVGMYLEEKEALYQTDDVLHVISRTNGNTRQYYYRRYESSNWTPFEKVSLNMEGDHIFPIIWRNQLFIFWLNIIEKPTPVDGSKTPAQTADVPSGNNTRKNVEINICWGEYYNGKWTSPKSTDLQRPMTILGLSTFDRKELLMHGRIETVETGTGTFRERVVFYILYGMQGSIFTFTSKNTAPYIDHDSVDGTLLDINIANDTMFRKAYEELGVPIQNYGTQLLMPSKNFQVAVSQPDGSIYNGDTESVLTKNNFLTNDFSILSLRHPIENQYEAPFIYADEHSTFFVQPNENIFQETVSDHDGFYTLPRTKVPEIPPLATRTPIKGWPEEIITQPGEFVSNPLFSAVRTPGINENVKNVLVGPGSFTYGSSTFTASGNITPVAVAKP